MIAMENEQKINLIFSSVFLLTGVIGAIYYSFFFYCLPLMLVSLIFFLGVGGVLYILTGFDLLPEFGIGYELYKSRSFRWEIYVTSIIIGFMMTIMFITEPFWRPYFFFLLVFGLALVGFGIYVAVTIKEEKI
jgi:uncharacterized membrane protein HdeD (DUF308 family)